MFQGHQINCFFVFFVFDLFCTLLWKDLGELLSVMERDPSYSKKIHYVFGNHSSVRGLVKRFQGSERTKKIKIYMRLVEGKRQIFFGTEMKLNV
jgi:hypothetical protein